MCFGLHWLLRVLAGFKGEIKRNASNDSGVWSIYARAGQISRQDLPAKRGGAGFPVMVPQSGGPRGNKIPKTRRVFVLLVEKLHNKKLRSLNLNQIK